MIFVVELKKHVANASIFNINIGKFRHKKKLYLVILFKIDKNLKINFYYTILLFSLTICLYIKGVKKSQLDIEEIT